MVDEIDGAVGVDPHQKVTCDEAVVAMILNALGFVDRPLYLFPEFMATKPNEGVHTIITIPALAASPIP